ncbi:hypothetical protein GUITHDRAFT_154450 [Guillardia theta CCMP2712]|uniref:Uncharacterized protein n=1 Tax=Guillardia theta (strain CCMP2712) TaxID=905079 RepID=L1ITX0_GUITC|nr:hypothetical protein GUITHDRAFT_154450 [Guillardia theta CCMP2712]EKX39314.1 hypothetical protein GUITHDRAFT_154450 [Guillardia theta CCMP2712]|eukprot:XP_005826294.1 hypothetical protein GUITHDRAFT_154450 [Guillardia theta CCMP2712]
MTEEQYRHVPRLPPLWHGVVSPSTVEPKDFRFNEQTAEMEMSWDPTRRAFLDQHIEPE